MKSCRATQDGQVMVESADKMWSTGEGESLQTTSAFLPWEPHEQYAKAKMYDTRISHTRSVGVQHATGEELMAITNSSRKNEAAGPKQKQLSVLDVSGGESKVQWRKEQYCTGTWNAKSMNQGHGTTDWFQIGKGVCQDYILSACLFNLYSEYITQNARLDESQARIKIAKRNINNLRYPDAR